ncbi:MAG: helix-turn-helix domain-containing protein [Desulfurivibrionaceae bacterium]
MRELFALDLNPLICMTRQLNSELALFKAWNVYQQHVSLSVRTIICEQSNELFTIHRRQVSYDIDPPAARDAALCAIDILKDAARCKREQTQEDNGKEKLNFSSMAAMLGLQRTVAFEAALCFEEMPGLKVSGLCRAMGCHRRTLERHFKEVGLTALELKMACALSGATNSLWGGLSLAEIAVEHGYSDQAHMTRAFRHACGLPPSVLRSLVHGSLVSNRQTTEPKSTGSCQQTSLITSADHIRS